MRLFITLLMLLPALSWGQSGLGDANCDDKINVGDAVFLINYIFKAGPAPNCPTEVPTLTTADVTSVTQTTAICGGVITSDGGSAVFVRGVCWSTNPVPTTTDNKTTDGYGTGSFSSSINSLIGDTTYYVRAYAINSKGAGYGNIRSFKAGVLTDIDGNEYQIVNIGTQVWMAENLKVIHYRNGDIIPNVADGSAWAGLTTGAFCEYNNDVNNVATYGRLYNWYAVSDERNIAPTGWHVPSQTELQTLIDFLGGNVVAGGKMKEIGTVHWASPNTGATNESGFTALPGGYCANNGTFGDMGNYLHFWFSSEYDNYKGWYSYIGYGSAAIIVGNTWKPGGFSVRCVKD